MSGRWRNVLERQRKRWTEQDRNRDRRHTTGEKERVSETQNAPM